MPQLLKPVRTKVVTKDGECAVDIAIELTININTDGVMTAQAQTHQVDSKKEEPEDNTLWAIPDFDSPDAFDLDFGKTEKGE